MTSIRLASRISVPYLIPPIKLPYLLTWTELSAKRTEVAEYFILKDKGSRLSPLMQPNARLFISDLRALSRKGGREITIIVRS